MSQPLSEIPSTDDSEDHGDDHESACRAKARSIEEPCLKSVPEQSRREGCSQTYHHEDASNKESDSPSLPFTSQ